MTKKIAYTTTEARCRRENIRANALDRAITHMQKFSDVPTRHRAELLASAKAFENFVLTGKIK